MCTTNKEYGQYWVPQDSGSESPYQSPRAQPPVKDHHYASEGYTGSDVRASQHRPGGDVRPSQPRPAGRSDFWSRERVMSPGARRRMTEPLPPITNSNKVYEGTGRNPLGHYLDDSILRLPGIKEVEILLHMDDSSVVRLKTVPHRPYQFD